MSNAGRTISIMKSTRRRVLDLIAPQRLVFHHVPKCGGTSVGKGLRMRYALSQATVTPESSFRAFEAFTGRSDRDQMLIDVLDLREQMLLYLLFEDIRCVSLHVPFSEIAHARFRDRYRFVTILREPVSRFISHYFWSHGKPHAHGRIEEDFAAFLETPRAKRLGATYAEFFSGLPKDSGITSKEAIERAVENLNTKFDVVGRLDHLPDFERDLRRTLGVRIRVGHENKGHAAEECTRSMVTPELVEQVRVLCAPDLAIWNGTIHG